MSIEEAIAASDAPPWLDPVPIPVPHQYPDGIYYGLSGEDYFAQRRFNATGAKLLLRSAAHYRASLESPKEPSTNMLIGSVVHVGVLEPAVFDARVAVAPGLDKRTKAGKALWDAFQDANAGKLVLGAEDFDCARRCIDAVRAHPAAAQLLNGAHTEVSAFWTDGKHKVPCKSRWDILNHNGIGDLKTTQDASRDAFSRSIATFGYDIQASLYLLGGEHLLHSTPEFFAFICVETAPPYAVAVYELGHATVEAGLWRTEQAMQRYRDAEEAQDWHGYPDVITTIDSPVWARRFDI
jgi:hypothetical protein